jgi:hypothetical protein
MAESVLNEYKMAHKYCPLCGSDDIRKGMVGYIIDKSHPESFKDGNPAECLHCGWAGTAHDLIGEDARQDCLSRKAADEKAMRMLGMIFRNSDNGIETGFDIEPVDYACSVIWVFRDLAAGGRTEYSEQIAQILRMAMEYLKLFIKSEGIDPYDQRIECVDAVGEAMNLLSIIKVNKPK